MRSHLDASQRGRPRRLGALSTHAAPLILAAAALMAATAPLHADWLVTRNGVRIETSGPWQVKGKLVIFKRAGGPLSSLKLADVDLAKSRDATVQAQKAAAKAKNVPKAKQIAHRKAVMTISDADVAHAEEKGGTEPAANASGASSGKKASSSQSDEVTGGLQVGDWQPTNSDDGVGMTGTLHNPGNDTVAGISLEVRLYDPQGKLIASGDAAVARAAIAPHGATTFRVSFPGVFDFTAVKFAVKGTRLGTAKPAPPASPSQNPPRGSGDQG